MRSATLHIDLLRRHIIGLCPHINLLVHIDTGDDKEDARSPGPTSQKTTQAEDDGSFVFLEVARGRTGKREGLGLTDLDDLDSQTEGEGQGEEDQEDGDEDHQLGTEALAILTCWGSMRVRGRTYEWDLFYHQGWRWTPWRC